MELEGITVFVGVVRAGSFSQAAKVLGMPNSTVSAKVSALEKRLGVTLLQRTTRKLNVTQAGEAYFKRCVRALEEIEAGEAEVTTSQSAPHGLLRITASPDVGQRILPEMIQAFLKKYPHMKVDLLLTNRVVDLVAEGVDLALRPGELEDSSLVARKLFDIDFKLWASPAYLKKHGKPVAPSDLAKHEFVKFGPFSERPFVLRNGKEKATIDLSAGRITADDLEAVKGLVLLGMGIGALAEFACEAEARSGQLVRLLPDWGLGSGSLSIVYPAQKFVSPKVRAFVDVIAVEFGA